MAQRRILLQFAHPSFERSRINKRLLDAVKDLPGVTLNDLYERYPRLLIDVAREQELLLAHDVIVFQHPFFWYSVPPLLKEWQDLVLAHGWAYGLGGDALRGKLTLHAITTGGPQAAYRPEGFNRFSVRTLLAPWDQTARLCGLRFLAPYVVHGAHRLDAGAELEHFAVGYKNLIESLRDDRLDLDRAEVAERVNEEVPP